MDPKFTAILQKLVVEHGKETLLNAAKCKEALSDYTCGEYKEESRLLFLALEAGVQNAIDTAENIAFCKEQQIRLFADIVNMLVIVLRGGDMSASNNLIFINGGTFIMGSNVNETDRFPNESPQHQVTVSPFYMGKYQVTQKEYEALMEVNPSKFIGDNLPVEGISWYDAVDYCIKLSQKEGLTPIYSRNVDDVRWNPNANGYRLPTEAEWEYACRAGTTTPFSTGNNITTSQANYNGNFPYINNPKGIYRKKTTVVGSFNPNPWGLYDMHGNVWEWCWDWYGDYSSGAQVDYKGASLGTHRVLRGGSWNDTATCLRSANRHDINPSKKAHEHGFRLVRHSIP
ncbi:formylglycine-generating enzyme family protein [Treponema sp. R80B11-R83G3]